LIIDHPEHFSFMRETQHRLHEIPPMAPVEPGRTYNHVLLMTATHGLLPLPFAAAIHPKGHSNVIFAVGASSRAIEHIIGRHVEQWNAALATEDSQVSHPIPIDGQGSLWLHLRLVNRRVGRGINKHVRLGIDQRLAETGRLRQVYLWPPLAHHRKPSSS
jgi:hypothetical protein